MLERVIQWLESHMQPCMYKQSLGFECPGCGFQRSLIELLRGNLWESLVTYPGLIPMMALFLFLILHLVFQFKKGATILKYIFIGDMAIIMIHYILKIIH
mgnify:CR=1 FL=1